MRQQLMPGALPLSCVWPTVGTALDSVRLSVRRQEKLNAQAVAAFYGETQADVECTDCALEVAPAALDVECQPPSLPSPGPSSSSSSSSSSSTNTPPPAGDPAAAARLLASGPVQAMTAVSGAGTDVLAPPAGGWRSAPDALPQQWDEASDVTGEQWELRKSEALRFISRRRAEPEAAEVLARKPLPVPHVPPNRPATEVAKPRAWPVGAPPRPIYISQLYYPGVYSDIVKAVDGVADDMAEAELEYRCEALPTRIRRRIERVCGVQSTRSRSGLEHMRGIAQT